MIMIGKEGREWPIPATNISWHHRMHQSLLDKNGYVRQKQGTSNMFVRGKIAKNKCAPTANATQEGSCARAATENIFFASLERKMCSIDINSGF